MGLSMIKSTLSCMGIWIFHFTTVFLCLTAGAFTVDQQLINTRSDFGAYLSEISLSNNQISPNSQALSNNPASPNNQDVSSSQTNTFFPFDSNQGLWIQENLGDDFYHYYVKKIVKKPLNKISLKLDYGLTLKPTSASTSTLVIDSKNSARNNVLVNHTIQALESPKISFSDDNLQWNPADIAMIELGDDYQKFVDDEINSGHTYKEFWDGVETTALEDFVDEHFGFHDNALIRALILMALFLVTVIAFAKRAELADFFLSEDNHMDRLKAWLKSLHISS